MAIAGMAVTLFISQTDKGFFLRVRDHLLFGNPAGEYIIRCYYKYTPLAALTIQSPLEQQLKPCWIHPELAQKDAILHRFGWLTVEQRIAAHLILKPALSSDKSATTLILAQRQYPPWSTFLPIDFMNPLIWWKKKIQKVK